jgi:hypothetical protein
MPRQERVAHIGTGDGKVVVEEPTDAEMYLEALKQQADEDLTPEQRAYVRDKRISKAIPFPFDGPYELATDVIHRRMSWQDILFVVVMVAVIISNTGGGS